ncbi:transport permease protein [Gemmatimonadetes bacterium T265]|nr:transport permease protein [Gemmatimonadetes bacterium T265]
MWAARDLLVALGMRDVRLRYKQTVLGVAWVVLQPLVAAGILSVVFGMVAKLPSDGVPYFLFSYVGFLAWNAFQSTLTRAGTSLVQHQNLLTKVYFPRLLLPLSTLFATTLDFLVGSALLAVLLVWYGVRLHPAVVAVPLLFASLQLFALGIGFVVATAAARYRDVQHLLPVATQFLLYASPVAYAISAVPPHLQRAFLFNPLTSLFEAFRWTLLGTGRPSWPALGYSVLMGVAAFGLGAWVFRRAEAQLADVI